MAEVNPTPTPGGVVCAVGTPACHLHNNGCGDHSLSHIISKRETKGTSVALKANYCAGGDLVFQTCHELSLKAGYLLSNSLIHGLFGEVGATPPTKPTVLSCDEKSTSNKGGVVVVVVGDSEGLRLTSGAGRRARARVDTVLFPDGYEVPSNMMDPTSSSTIGVHSRANGTLRARLACMTSTVHQLPLHTCSCVHPAARAERASSHT